MIRRSVAGPGLYGRIIASRCFSKLYQGDDKLRSYVSKPIPTKPDPTWTRLAHKIKDVELETEFSKNKHLEQLRTVYDPQEAIAKLEDEIQEEIASSLGKTGGKCQLYFTMLKRLAVKYENSTDIPSKNRVALLFNDVRTIARASRRDLIIHRQAAGFTFQNHRIVESEFPLPAKLPILGM